MAQKKKARQKTSGVTHKASQKPGKKTNKAKPARSIDGSSFVWILIVIGVALGAYYLIVRTNQREIALENNSLPSAMSVADVAKLDADEYLFLDVREPDEWTAGHIGWATLIPLGQLEDRSSELSKQQKIVVVCRSGNRSAQARDILLKQGFEAVTSMAGGMNDWQAQGNPVVVGP